MSTSSGVVITVFPSLDRYSVGLVVNAGVITLPGGGGCVQAVENGARWLLVWLMVLFISVSCAECLSQRHDG